MGWDGVKLKGKTDKHVLDHVLGELNRRWEVLEHHITGDAVYLAVKLSDTEEQDPGRVIGFVVVYEHTPDGWTMFKWMDEDMGPCACDAPASLIQKLSPVKAGGWGYATEWRRRCLEYGLPNRRKTVRRKPAKGAKR